MLCRKIKNLRIKKGLTQNQLAELYGATPTNIYQLENGKRAISIEALQKLSIILEFTFIIKDGEITLKENTYDMEELIQMVKNEIKKNTHKYEFLVCDEMEFRVAKYYNFNDELIYCISICGEVEKSIYIIQGRDPGKERNYKISLHGDFFRWDKLDWGMEKFDENEDFREIVENLKGECIINTTNECGCNSCETSYESIEIAIVAAIKTLKLLIDKKVKANDFSVIYEEWQEIYHVVLRDKLDSYFLYRDVVPSINAAMIIIKNEMGTLRKKWLDYFGESLIGYPGEVYKNNKLIGKFVLDDDSRDIVFVNYN